MIQLFDITIKIVCNTPLTSYIGSAQKSARELTMLKCEKANGISVYLFPLNRIKLNLMQFSDFRKLGEWKLAVQHILLDLHQNILVIRLNNFSAILSYTDSRLYNIQITRNIYRKGSFAQNYFVRNINSQYMNIPKMSCNHPIVFVGQRKFY